MSSTPPAGQRPSYDLTLKRLLTRAHDGFLALIAPDLTWRGERSPELPAVARQADLVWEVASPAGVPGILHIELQTYPDDEMGERLREYAIRLWRRDHLPVRSAVVFVRPTPLTPGSPYVIQWDGREMLRYDFDVVRLWDIPQEQVFETFLKIKGHYLTPVTRCGCFHLLDSLLSLWYACSSTLNNRILFAGSKVQSFPWVKAVACLPLCCRGDACNSLRLDLGQRLQVNSLRCISSSPTSGSSPLCD
ncbi:MAG TPA: hypothetical protein VKC57_07780 [Ktedonobacterales bacterium]|nr:hypothetical protein [Ktedonobacterales bacterium]